MKKFLSFLICIVLVFSLCSCTEEYLPIPVIVPPHCEGKLIVHFIDVGQGDCVLLESDNEFMIIDGGEAEYSATVCEYLLNNDVTKLSYVVATHPHSDHCGSLSDVINTFECDNFITVETNQQTKTWLNVLSAVQNNGVNYIDAKVSSTYTLGNSTFEILGPNSDYYEEYNNYSVVIKATCGNTSFLFTGDAEQLAEREMLQNNADLSADVLKLGHHGSSTSSCTEFITAVSPRYGVISCGKNNDYGHPHKEPLKTLRSFGTTIYRTDEMGTIVAVSDANDISFFYENEKSGADHNSHTTYIGNYNSLVFHSPNCMGVQDMNEKNKVVFKTRDEALKNGYSPCNKCKP